MQEAPSDPVPPAAAISAHWHLTHHTTDMVTLTISVHRTPIENMESLF